jgi:carboxyl-terminal processing protease
MSFKPVRLLLAIVLVIVVWMIASGPVPGARAEDQVSPYQEIQLMTDVLSIIQKNYVEEVDLHVLIEGAIKGMTDTLDPHSNFMPPEVYREMKIDTRGEFGGLGIEITIRDGLLTVVAPIEDTPADRAGLQSGDQIVRVDGKPAKSLSIMDAVKLMRGPAGSPLKLTIMRDSLDKPKDYEIIREIIQIKSVRARLLDQGIGYVRLTQFQERTAEDLSTALQQMRSESGAVLTGLILDLRNNPGGLLDQAVKVSDLFLPSGLIVYTEGREDGSKMRFSAHQQDTEPDYPLIVLIDEGSASASEIVAGALQDHRRAVVLGTQSFGKGSVQTIIPMSDGSGLRLTTARYFTPHGTSIQARGITPDIPVRQIVIDPVANAGDEHYREANLENHFDPIEPEKNPDTVKQVQSRLQAEDLKDYQLMRAFDLLKGLRVFSRADKKAA